MYRRTREHIDGHPCFASATGRHLFRHPDLDQWHLHPDPFDPAETNCTAYISAFSGPVPTGTRAWRVVAEAGGFVVADMTAREVDAVAAAALEAAREAAAAGLAAAVAQVA